jgi:hypothetical protein
VARTSRWSWHPDQDGVHPRPGEQRSEARPGNGDAPVGKLLLRSTTTIAGPSPPTDRGVESGSGVGAVPGLAVRAHVVLPFRQLRLRQDAARS